MSAFQLCKMPKHTLCTELCHRCKVSPRTFFFFPVTVFGFQCLLEREGCGELEPAGQNILSEAQQFFSAFFFFQGGFLCSQVFLQGKNNKKCASRDTFLCQVCTGLNGKKKAHLYYRIFSQD